MMSVRLTLFLLTIKFIQIVFQVHYISCLLKLFFLVLSGSLLLCLSIVIINAQNVDVKLQSIDLIT